MANTAPAELLGKRIIAAVRLARYERAVERALLAAVLHQQERALALLRTVRADALPGDLFDEASWNDELERTVKPIVDGIFAEIEGDVSRFFAGPGELPEIDLTHRLDRLLGAMRGLSPDLSKRLGDSLTEGVNRGESIDKLSARVRDTFGVGESRAGLIARTETVGAANGAADDAAGAMVRGGIGMEKTWLATLDARTRPTHQRANTQTVPYDQPFKVGTHELMFPGDPGGPVEEIANCRCTTLYDEAKPTPEVPARVTFEPSEFTAAPARRVGASKRGLGGHLVPIGENTKVAKGVRTSKAAIDKVHCAPRLLDSPLPVEQSGGTRTLGQYQWQTRFGSGDVPMRIRVSSSDQHQAMTFTHEFGHFFDHMDWDDPSMWTTFKASTGRESPVDRWWAAVKDSPAIERLHELNRMAFFESTEGKRYPINHAHVSYLLDVREIWARSYAQWIAAESGDATMLAELEAMRAGRDSLAYYPHQWDDEEFAPIAEAFRQVFRDQGLLNE